MRNLFWLFIILLTIGCKDANVQKELAEMKAEKPVDPKKLKLPSSCEMISQEKV